MLTVSILEPSDIVLATDWCRPLRLVSMSGGMSDSYSFESEYSGNPENNVRWCRVGQVFGDHLIGRTVEDFHEIIQHCGVPHEFVRGDIPKSHQYGPTVLELGKLYEMYLVTNVMQFGKYKEMSYNDIKEKDRSYFDWAVSKDIIDDFQRFGYNYENI